MSTHPALKEYLANWTGDSDDRVAISRTIESIAEACIEISALPGRAIKRNPSGLPNLPRGWNNTIVIHI